jgi:hypothetical protein
MDPATLPALLAFKMRQQPFQVRGSVRQTFNDVPIEKFRQSFYPLFAQ